MSLEQNDKGQWIIPKERRISSFKVLTEDTENTENKEEGFIPEHMHEGVERPFKLHGTTYKIKPMGNTRGIYLTINDIILNEGTDHEKRYPYEMFLNSRQMENFEWITAITCFVSAVFRKGGNVAFIAEELEATFSPKGAYMGPDHLHPHKKKFYDSIVSEIGTIVKLHFIELGIIKPEYTIAEEQEMAQAKSKNEEKSTTVQPGQIETGVTCPECSEPNMQKLDGCYTCVNGCGFSKCG